MPIITPRSLRYLRSWYGDRAPVSESDATLDRDGTEVPATVIRPSRRSSDLPAWVVLHGVTRTGRDHAQMRRFARALAASGAVAIVPEVPEWIELRLAPHLATPTVAAALEGLRARPDVDAGRLGVVGFSFGAPHGIAAAGEGALAQQLAKTVGFGGYCNIESTFRFMMTGGCDGGPRPDPYGRWIVGANYVTEVPGLEEHTDVERALFDLAVYSSDVGDPAWLEVYDPKIEELRARVAPAHRVVFDLFAPPSTRLPDPAGLELADLLAEAARRVAPELDPVPRLGRVHTPTHIVHGRDDRLIPASEAFELRSALPPETPVRVTVTRLFAHSAEDPLSPLRTLAEAPRFVHALSLILGSF